jgi:hypothetical protein
VNSFENSRSEWFDEARAQKNSGRGGFGNFKLLFGNVGANLAKDREL